MKKIPTFSFAFREYLRLRQWYNLAMNSDDLEAIQSAHDHLLSLREDAYFDELKGIDDLLLELDILLDPTMIKPEKKPEKTKISSEPVPALPIVDNFIVLDFEQGELLKKAERKIICAALNHTENNRTKAAKILGISIRGLRNKINEYLAKDLPY